VGLFDQNQCVTVDKDCKLRVINRAKFFQPGHQHEFEMYEFSEVLHRISDNKDAPTEIGFPDSKSNAFEVEFDLMVRIMKEIMRYGSTCSSCA